MRLRLDNGDDHEAAAVTHKWAPNPDRAAEILAAANAQPRQGRPAGNTPVSAPSPLQAQIQARLGAAGARSKYGSRRTEYGGRVFASKAEARRAQELHLLELAGEIRDLELQVPFDLVVNGQQICRFVADFRYRDTRSELSGSTWQEIVEDCKGVRTREYQIKKRLMRAVLGIEIVEVEA